MKLILSNGFIDIGLEYKESIAFSRELYRLIKDGFNIRTVEGNPESRREAKLKNILLEQIELWKTQGKNYNWMKNIKAKDLIKLSTEKF